MPTPRCFLIRHGETEWSLSGRHTGSTDIPLTENGHKRMQATGKALVGDDRLVVPRKLVQIYVSPRTRAHQTLDNLRLGLRERPPWTTERETVEDEPLRTEAKLCVTEAVREWDYGEYEGWTSKEIKAATGVTETGKARWDIWRDGCPGGESPEDIINRLDPLIAEIREKFHSKAFDGDEPGDVLIVAHGHILRAFAMRWMGKPLSETSMILEAGGVGLLSYEHHDINEPAIVLGGGFVVD